MKYVSEWVSWQNITWMGVVLLVARPPTLWQCGLPVFESGTRALSYDSKRSQKPNGLTLILRLFLVAVEFSNELNQIKMKTWFCWESIRLDYLTLHWWTRTAPNLKDGRVPTRKTGINKYHINVCAWLWKLNLPSLFIMVQEFNSIERIPKRKKISFLGQSPKLWEDGSQKSTSAINALWVLPFIKVHF